MSWRTEQDDHRNDPDNWQGQRAEPRRQLHFDAAAYMRTLGVPLLLSLGAIGGLAALSVL